MAYAKVPKDWNGSEIALSLCYRECQFLPKANCDEKKLVRGKKGGSICPVSRNETFVSFGLI